MTSDGAARLRAFRVAYDGTGYHGFQRQPTVSTVEGAILDGLTELGVTTDPDTIPPSYAAAGRTDAGVSAIAQTVGFEAPPWLTPSVLNGVLPEDIWVWADAEVEPGFHARHDAVERVYEYRLHLGTADIDIDLAVDTLDRLTGDHDFHNLTPDQDGTRRSVAGDIRRDGRFLVITVQAGGFPRQLVRRIVAVVESVSTGEAEPSYVDRLLDAQPIDGPLGVEPASPEPLLLADVIYPSVDFTADPDAVDSIVAALADRRARLETRTSLTRRLAKAIDEHP